MAHHRIPAFQSPGLEKPKESSAIREDDGFADVLPFRSLSGQARADFQSVLTKVAELANILTGATGSALAFRSDHGTICRARSGEDGPALGAPVNTTTGISKQCLDTGSSLRCDDVRTDDRVDPEVAVAVAIRSIAVVPILQNGKISGVLAVFSRTPGTFNDRHLKLLEHLASLVEFPTGLVIEEGPRKPSETEPKKVEQPKPSEINLLVEPESAYRVFFHNLAELASRPAPIPKTSRLDYGWDHVFVDTQLPWKRFGQSIALHLAVIALAFGLGAIWPRELTLSNRPLRQAQITYYPAAEAYPSKPQPASTSAKRTVRRTQPTQQAAAPKTRNVLVVPRGSGNRRTEIAAAAAPNLTMRQNQKLEMGASGSVLPAPPDAGAGGQSRRLGLPGYGIVAPAPEIGTGAGSRRLSAPGTTIVAPAPDVQGATMRAGGSRLGGGVGGDANSVVPPAPSLSGHSGATYRGGSGLTSQSGVQVVGPPPSLQAGTTGGRGNAVSIGTGGAEVVPPPASLDGTGSSLGKGRGTGIAGGSDVVPPPPALQSAGKYGQGRQLGTIAGTGGDVVPPSPSLQNGDGSGGIGQGRYGSLGGTGTGVAGPPPSIEEGSGVGQGRYGSLNGTGTAVAGPPPSVEGGSGTLGGRRGAGSQLGTQGALPPASGQGGSGDASSSANASAGPESAKSKLAEKQATPPQDVQLRLISAAWSPARSSYFSNYEVFIAEKWTNKQSQLIKLVYVFLPYQKRLSEYGADAKVHKLRVVRDRTCDESLMQMEWPDDNRPPAAVTAQKDGSSDSADRNSKLPCYRTTADDYRRAVSGTH
jgi:GAF domain-containing protein